jgi:hypothetical protein
MALAASFAAATGCASVHYGRMEPPDGARAVGVEFGADRDTARRNLRTAGVDVYEVPNDPDVLLANRCPAAPAKAPCRLLFGPGGLYAVQVELPASEARALADAVEEALGEPDVAPDARAPGEGLAQSLGAWHRPGWTVGVSRVPATRGQPSLAVLRIEYDAAAPPVIAGVPLGRARADVEQILERQGATIVQREAASSIYLACPMGASEAITCVVHFQGGRAAAVTEIHQTPPDDKGALAAWRLLAKRFEKDVSRAPAVSCPDFGPERVEGDCTATWSSDRLVVVVGAHRNAGSQHRGPISVYTTFTYPPLAQGDEETETAEVR